MTLHYISPSLKRPNVPDNVPDTVSRKVEEEARSGSNCCQRRVEGQLCLKIVCDGKLFSGPFDGIYAGPDMAGGQCAACNSIEKRRSDRAPVVITLVARSPPPPQVQ